jgi:SAM-dependent methyltransferase
MFFYRNNFISNVKIRLKQNKQLVKTIQTIKYLHRYPEDLQIILKDKISGIDTWGSISAEDLNLSPDLASEYAPSSNKCLQQVLDSLNITERDSIIDLGSGKGSAIIFFAKYPFQKVAGVELSDRIYRISLANLKKLKLDRISLFHLDAEQFKDFDTYNYVYLYNPFPEAIMKKVLNNICLSLQNNPRSLAIIYKNPVAHQTIVNTGIFQKISEFDTEFKHKLFLYKSL